ncbi:MAG: hypothetical protein PHY59_01165 [Methanobacterium sp.]|nr:hypothetical protein [Methanobacterium sp.]
MEEAHHNTYKYELKDHYEPKPIEGENYDKIEKKEKKVRIKNPNLYLLLKSKGNIKNFFVNKKAYDYLKDSRLFNENYYLKKYPKIKKSGMDPLLHYIIFGYKEGKLPSANFDGNHYLNKYKNVKKSGINTLCFPWQKRKKNL